MLINLMRHLLTHAVPSVERTLAPQSVHVVKPSTTLQVTQSVITVPHAAKYESVFFDNWPIPSLLQVFIKTLGFIYSVWIMLIWVNKYIFEISNN